MLVENTQIADVLLITPRVFADERGFFMETWNQNAFAKKGMNFNFVQDNHSKSVKGTLRGLHYQTENTQGKLVRVTLGKVFDVAVDLRKNSPTFGKWVGAVLSDENRQMLWVPPQFAHGFYVMSEIAEFQYKCTDFYNPAAEKTIMWNDSDIGIEWPLNSEQPLLSEKDKKGVPFCDAKVF
ncbi:MAG: dTDP-4-dehydrorhamnose 3,5-epimerase [Candidatus Ozemobacteraceae bacterium]|jgi:dTDP-4-dehydrorhamnose 3,5-epimerase